MSDSKSTERLKKGDIVLNGYAAEGFNDLHVIIGSSSRKTGPYSITRYWETRCLFKGKLMPKSLFSKTDNKLTKIGHVDYEGFIVDKMSEARDTLNNQSKELK